MQQSRLQPKPLPKLRDTAKSQHVKTAKVPAKASNKAVHFSVGAKQITLLPKPKRGTLTAFGYSTKLSRAGRIQALVRAAKKMGSYGKVIRHLNLIATLSKKRTHLYKIYRSDMADLGKLNYAAKKKKQLSAAAAASRKTSKATHPKRPPTNTRKPNMIIPRK